MAFRTVLKIDHQVVHSFPCFCFAKSGGFQCNEILGMQWWSRRMIYPAIHYLSNQCQYLLTSVYHCCSYFLCLWYNLCMWWPEFSISIFCEMDSVFEQFFVFCLVIVPVSSMEAVVWLWMEQLGKKGGTVKLSWWEPVTAPTVLLTPNTLEDCGGGRRGHRGRRFKLCPLRWFFIIIFFIIVLKP